MNAVVIRCPNCGTTQGELGTCDTCHEAEVAYYCPNHAPGRWIDGPECADCGARFGMAAPPPVSGPVSPPPGARPPVEWRPPGRARPSGMPPAPAAPRGRPRRPPAGRDDPVRVDPRDEGVDPRFEELLEHLRRGGAPLGGPMDPREGTWTPIDPAAAARGVARGVARGALGCIGRLVMVAVVLAILAMLALGGFFGYADLDDRRVVAASSTHVEDRHPLHVHAVPHPGQGRLDLRARA